jgi:hypothetical protein
MAKNIEPTLKLISGYLKLEKDENFVIPEYQRGYSWEITHCDKLWQDIEVFIVSNASDPYFFGTIIVDCSVGGKFSLIDGQQRTTTFLLLLKALLIRLNAAILSIPDEEDSEALKAGLQANRNKIMAILFKAEDEEIPSMLKDHSKTQGILLIENKSINELYSGEVIRIIEAIDYESSEAVVHKLPRKQKDNKYTHHFRNFKYFFNKLGEKSESQLNQFAKVFLEKCQVIEIRSWQVEQAITMFNSLNSTGMPLSDADIISAQLYSNADGDREEFNKRWESLKILADSLNSHKIVDIDSILQQFMYINRAINKEYLRDASVDVTTPGLRRYYTEIRKELLNDPIGLCANLTKIADTWNEIKDYANVKLLLKCNENAKLFLSSYLFRYETAEVTRELVSEVCECLLRLFVLLELSSAGYSSTKFKTFLFSENIKFVDINAGIETIKVDFDEHVWSSWDKESIRASILDYDKNLLVFLNEYLFARDKDLAFDFSENVNVEHIMPSSGRNITTIQEDAGIAEKDEFTALVNKLGNKILLEEDINKSIGNDWFRTKKQTSILTKSGFKDSRYGIANALTTYPNNVWTKDDIKLATDKAVARILKFIFNENEAH